MTSCLCMAVTWICYLGKYCLKTLPCNGHGAIELKHESLTFAGSVGLDELDTRKTQICDM